MANQKSDYLENKNAEHNLGVNAFTMPSVVYVGLFTAPPGEAGGGTEITGNAYARQIATFGSASGGLCANTTLIVFPIATPGAWGTITDYAIFDAVSGGNELYYGTLTSPQIINAHGEAAFDIGQLTVQEF